MDDFGFTLLVYCIGFCFGLISALGSMYYLVTRVQPAPVKRTNVRDLYPKEPSDE